jgi:hypothetical protein
VSRRSWAAAPLGALLVASLGTVACFDVHTVEQGPLVIDDFDDGDFLPADPDFDAWSCFSFNPDSNQMYRCDQGTGANNTKYSLFLDFTITDAPNSNQDHGGASLATFASKPVDFTKFSEIVFSNMLESGSPALPSNALLYIELGCSKAADDQGDVPGDFYVLKGADYDNYWQTRRLTLDNFGPPSWIKRPIKGGTAGCLSLVDSFRFTVDAQLSDGQVGRGTLRIDGITLQ